MPSKPERHAPRWQSIRQVVRLRPIGQRSRSCAATTAIVGILALLLLIVVSGRSTERRLARLPVTLDYHSLLVRGSNPERLLLGTHSGLYASDDGGRHWRFQALADEDALSLARSGGDSIWLVGHRGLRKSVDGGTLWFDVRPSGLPGFDIHAFALDPHDRNLVYAALAGQGLYRSTDGGNSFSLASRDVGGNVVALAVFPDGRILAGDPREGLLESRDKGASWRKALPAQLKGVAINAGDPRRILVSGLALALSTDGGRTWRFVLELPDGVGPVAWSTSDPKTAYAVGANRILYRSGDGGKTWSAVDQRS